MKFSPLFLLMGVIGLAGCSHTITTLHAAPAPKMEADWRILSDKKGLMSIGAPPGWGFPGTRVQDATANPVTEEGAGDLHQEMAQEMSQMGSGLEPDEPDTLMHIVDLNVRAIPGEPRTGYKIRHEQVSGGTDLESATKQTRSQNAHSGTPKTLDLPIGKASEFRFKFTTIGGDEINRIIYVLVNNEDVYRITFSQVGSDGSIKELSKQVIQTFRVKKPAPKS